jgi:hypothetical protein
MKSVTVKKPVRLFATMPLIVGIAGSAFFSQAWAVVPGVDTIGIPAITQCPTVSPVPLAFHSDKIVFVITGGLVANVAVDQLALNSLPRNLELDIKVRDNPTRVANLKAKVLSFLGASLNPATPNFANIRINDVEYTAVVCPKLP